MNNASGENMLTKLQNIFKRKKYRFLTVFVPSPKTGQHYYQEKQLDDLLNNTECNIIEFKQIPNQKSTGGFWLVIKYQSNTKLTLQTNEEKNFINEINLPLPDSSAIKC